MLNFLLFLTQWCLDLWITDVKFSSVSYSKSLWIQGLNYVAALLLLVMKTEEDAFWMLAVLLENVLVNDCYTNNLSGCHVEQTMFKDLLAKKCPRYYYLWYLWSNLSCRFLFFTFHGFYAWIPALFYLCCLYDLDVSSY